MSQYKKSFLLVPFLLLFFSEAGARIKWDEPKTINEKLSRRNRRVLRFSGQAKPGSRVRIRKNRIKIHLDSGGARRVSIPRKNSIQFPIIVDKSGIFSFDLYLPTTFVEIPVEVRRRGGKAWKLSPLKFQVPEIGAANDLQSIEESFAKQTSDEEAEQIVADIESDTSHHSRANEGMVVRDRNERKQGEKMALRLWGGLGTSYFLTNVASSIIDHYDESGTALVVPSWRLGGDWDFSKEFYFRANMYQGSGNTEDIGEGPNVEGSKSFSWYEFQISVIWFSKILNFLGTSNLALDLGFQYQSLPFYRQDCEETWGGEWECRFSYFDNSVYSLHFGLFYKNNWGKWNYEAYGRYVFPVMVGDAFEMDSLLPINYEFGGVLRRSITKDLSLGIDAQVHFFGADVKYKYRDIESSDIISGLDLLLFTLGVRFIMDF